MTTFSCQSPPEKFQFYQATFSYPASMPNPLSLTFGVEIECIISFDPAEFEPALIPADGILWKKQLSPILHRESKLCIIFRKRLGDFLRENSFPTYDVTSLGGDQQWTVSNDTSINIKDGPRAKDGFLECDIEIKSPALRFCPRALRRVQKVLLLITQEFDAFVNTSCGLHVHIGNRKKGFSLQTLKNFCMLTAMFEQQLNSLHPAHRIGNHHVKGPSAVFGGQNPWENMQRIQRCDTKSDLVLLYANNEGRPDRCFAYNLCPMVSGPHKTIEFRQHEATLDWSKITNWIQVVGGIVDAMHRISVLGLAQLISTSAFDPRFTVSDLLLRLKLESLIAYYNGNLHAHQRPEPFWVRGKIVRNAKAVPRQQYGLDRWEQMERRHRLEKLEELEILNRRHELERRRELERQDEDVDSRRADSG